MALDHHDDLIGTNQYCASQFNLCNVRVQVDIDGPMIESDGAPRERPQGLGRKALHVLPAVAFSLIQLVPRALVSLCMHLSAALAHLPIRSIKLYSEYRLHASSMSNAFAGTWSFVTMVRDVNVCFTLHTVGTLTLVVISPS